LRWLKGKWQESNLNRFNQKEKSKTSPFDFFLDMVYILCVIILIAYKKRVVIKMFINNTKEEAESKLILLYIFDKFEIPITNSQITELVMETELLNYFTLQQFLSELVNSSLIEYLDNDDNYYYLITEKGRNALNYFKKRLVKDITQKIDSAVEKKKKLILKETKVSANYIKNSDTSYIVNLKVIENNVPLINLELDVVSNKEAKKICDNWKSRAQYIYGKILDLLIE